MWGDRFPYFLCHFVWIPFPAASVFLTGWSLSRGLLSSVLLLVIFMSAPKWLQGPFKAPNKRAWNHRLSTPLLFFFFLKRLFFFFFFFSTLFIYLFIFGCVGSSVRARAFSGYGKWGPLFIAVRGPLFIAVRGPFTTAAPPVAEHRLQTRRLSSCGSRAQVLRGMWDPPRPGLEPVSPALAGRFSTTAPPGKPHNCWFWYHICVWMISYLYYTFAFMICNFLVSDCDLFFST